MATASDDPKSIRGMEEELSCHICYNFLREPKDLDCPHVYCLQCLQKLLGDQSTVKCPECCYITIVPPGGLANLKTNLRVKAIVDIYAGSLEQKEVPVCPTHAIAKMQNAETKTKPEQVQGDLTKVEDNKKVTSPLFAEIAATDSRRLKFTLSTEFGTFQKAQGIAASKTGLIVVCDTPNNTVTVFQKDCGEYKCQFSLDAPLLNVFKKMSKPLAVAVTSEDKFLVSDNGVVKVFSPSGRYERDWKSVGASGFARTPDDMIVIGNRVKQVITVHKCDEELIRMHQADCKTMQDIASNGKQITFTTVNPGKVCAIDFVTGQTLWTLDMVSPLGICYEQKSNTLLVAHGSREKGNNLGHFVIDQYCSVTGHLISCLASGLRNPIAMTILPDSTLAVADLKSVKIYNIQ